VRKILLLAGALVLAALLAALAMGAWLVARLDTPGFRKTLLDQASATAGAEVRVKEMDVSLLSGVTLKGITIANPAPFPGNLLTADAFHLRYRLRPLLAGRLEVERLALERPALRLAVDARGVFNYERLGGPARPASPAPARAAAAPLRVVLKRLSVEDASIAMTDHAGSRLLTMEGVDLRSSFEVERGTTRGSGEARVAKIDLAGLLFLDSVRAPLQVSKEELRLAPIRGRLAGGEATGDVTVRLKGGFRYVARLEARDAQVKTLLAEAKSTAGVEGALQAKATLEGSGGIASMKGRGEGTITHCRLEDNRTMALLAQLLKLPELADPDFEECRAEFVQAGRRLSTPVLSLKRADLHLTGRGTVDLRDSSLDYDMRLALAPKLFAKVTRPELRPAFEVRSDGRAAIDFRLYGTTLEPKTDLLARVGTAAAADALKNQLDRLFRKKSP
jgi:small nuclear ribonucleoprotein (snRNP)-like protein